MFACSYGAAFGAIQHMPRIVPGPAGGRGRLPRPAAAADRERRAVLPGDRRARRTLLLAFLAVRIVCRRAAAAHFQVPGLSSCRSSSCSRRRPALEGLKWGIFLAGFSRSRSSASGGTTCRACIPRTCAGTGESFAANVGGRMFGTSAALRDDDARQLDARQLTGADSWPTRPPSSASLVYASASSPASGCPSQQARSCRSTQAQRTGGRSGAREAR